MAPQITGQLTPVKKGPSVSQDPNFSKHLATIEKWSKVPPGSGSQMDSVFFHGDRFELIVDARGFRPEDLKCIITPEAIDVSCERHETATGGQSTFRTNRNYQLSRTVRPEAAICCLSCEGYLLIAVPWA